MTRYDSRRWFLAACLAALAGYVDAIGFLKLGGLFVSFMSGNSTRLAVGLAELSGIAGLALAIVAAFVGGVVAGEGAPKLDLGPKGLISLDDIRQII